MMIVETFDFHDAIYAYVNRVKVQDEPDQEVIVDSVDLVILDVAGKVNENANIVRTDHGKFYCESFEDTDATIYIMVEKIFTP